ncbi:ester cyclase [Sulfitobacter geojensis]|uniref:Ester cyclase n=1 Tax=Sulfitobacter geojensis TaxID=1342299 RepID=A0AAE2W1A7_9RHOB|nr:ester cyclase [Sulfitobacter geojensis]MBM1690639.1 ester cyclase [Sulfitobacter geojensis]MBM1694705.1 ester cyclase [Sulfitobacter geojensis]MBM1707589.1 ester cyclase [Sulfitobacter geojensis]MBM1711199.1 ester cyclase [Sulfitobacter geojensis]MBM1715714.1 ester cyclase [Sulfitobacter geojensis]
MTFKTLFASATLATLATGAFADDTETVSAFYEMLSNPGSQSHVAAFVDATSENWVSVGGYSGTDKTRDAFIGQVGSFGQLMPDLNWAVQDIHQDENFVTVRSRATGTPVAPFFGVDGEGRSFDIMTIDIHQLENGEIVKTWHVEDWAGALQQLSGK